MTSKDIQNMRKRTSKKTAWIIHTLLIFVLLVYLGSTWLYWNSAHKFAHKAGISFLEIPNYDLSGIYTGVQIKARELFFKGILNLILSVFVITAWIIGVFLRRRDKRIIEYVDGINNETNQRVDLTR